MGGMRKQKKKKKKKKKLAVLLTLQTPNLIIILFGIITISW